MARRARVELPSSDAPNVIGAWLSVVCGLAIGVGAVAWLRAANESARPGPPQAAPPRPEKEAASSRAPVKPAAPPTKQGSPGPVVPAAEIPRAASEPSGAASITRLAPSEPARALDAGPPASGDASSQGNAPAGAQQAAPRTPRVLELVPGRVAYVRCDGVTKQAGRFPCPRDRALERSVWEALRSLERCPTLGSGGADVRLEFGPEGPPAVHVLSPRSGDGLDRGLVAKCAGVALGQTRTALRADRMLVAFEVTLRGPP